MISTITYKNGVFDVVGVPVRSDRGIVGYEIESIVYEGTDITETAKALDVYDEIESIVVQQVRD